MVGDVPLFTMPIGNIKSLDEVIHYFQILVYDQNF